ncbi:MAG: hypothetical protein R3Y35_06515 [Clostridia bacterium]
MNKTKRLLALFLALSMTLCACSTSSSTDDSSTNSSDSSSGTSTDEETSYVNPDGEFPIVDEQITLEVMAPSQTNIEDMETNTFTLYYEDLTNIHIDWNIVSEDSLSEKVSISLSTNTMPDIYLACGITQTQQSVYGSQGAFVPLNDYVDEYGSTLQYMFDNIQNLESIMTMSDGNMYSLPKVTDVAHTYYPYKVWLNNEWLDNLGLEVPTTTEEFEAVLTAFDEYDANGNGDADDEIPFMSYNGGYNSTIFSGFIFNAFVYSPDDTNYVYLNDGEIQISYEQDGWLEAVTYLNDLYEQGLFYDQSFTLAKDMATQISTNSDGDLTVGAFTASSPVNLLGADSDLWSEYVALSPLEGTQDAVSTWLAYSAITTSFFVVTSECEYPEAAFRWGVSFYDADISFFSTHGVEGENWALITPGEGDIPADATDVNTGAASQAEMYIDGGTYSDLQNFCWRSLTLYCDSTTVTDLMYQEYLTGTYDDNIEIKLAYDTTDYLASYAPDIDTVLPTMVYTEEQSTALATYETIIITYVEEMTTAFITGTISLDEWDSYIAELDNKGLQELKAIYQDAYDSKYGA